MIPLSDIYEAVLNALEKGELTKEQETKVLSNLVNLEWIKKMITSLDGPQLVGFYIKMVNELKGDNYPPDPMSISCMYYQFKQRLDADTMRETINTSEYLYKETKQLLLNEYHFLKN
jgi:hypothetical protein